MKTLRQLKDFDTISINMSTDKCRRFFKEEYKRRNEEHFKLSIYIPLQEGVIKSIELADDGLEFINYIYFKDYEEHFIAEFYSYDRATYDFNYLMTLKVNEFSDDRDVTSYELIDYDKNNSENLEKRSRIMFSILETLLLYICYTKDNPKTKIAKQRTKYNKNTNTGLKPVRKTHSVVLGEKVIYEVNMSDSSSKAFKKRNRYTESWSVMSFPRKLKNGKTIMVKSHTRGNGSKSKKSYVING